MRAIGIADLSEAKGLDIMGAYTAVIVQSQTHKVALQARLILLEYPPMRQGNLGTALGMLGVT